MASNVLCDKNNIQYCNIIEKIFKFTDNENDIKFLKEYIKKEEYVLEIELKMWNEYKNNISKNMLYSIYNFKEFIQKKLKDIKIIKLKDKINKIEEDEKNREYLNELIECEIVDEDNLHKWTNYKKYKNKYLEYKNKYFKNKSQIYLNFVKFLDDEGDSITSELTKLEKEKLFKDILDKHNLEINIYNEYIMQKYLSNDDIDDRMINEIVKEIREINHLYKENL